MELKTGSGVLFMKVGTHAQETLDDIIARKRKEIESAGFAMWGYGGNTCHPISMVRPFARQYERRGGMIYLCMHAMTSKHFAEPVRAAQFSIDGVKWEDIPELINVLGSRYALMIKDLEKDEFPLSLHRTKVAVGASLGRSGDRYVAGRVDKACLEVTEDMVGGERDEKIVQIGLVATIVDPYAVIVR
jgi:hypothetical protein